ncbi:MAG TPA: protein kinase [Polyangia bacterium]|jgi:hypothetical protein
MQLLPCPACRTTIRGDGVTALGACPRCGESLIVGGRFRMQELLGQGGTAVVYAGREERTGRKVAIKLLNAAQDHDTTVLFEHGARVLEGLDHPGLPRVYDFSQDGLGRQVLVREAFDGGSLEERILTQRRRMDPLAFRRLLESLLRTLAYLHGLVPPVYHRDVKPANVMFRTRWDWDPVLCGFDTVALPLSDRGPVDLVGTPGYSAPEQLAGEVSAAADLYALGMTMLLVATHLEPGDLPRSYGRLDLGDALANLEPSVRSVLLKLAEPDPRDRFKRAEEALAALRPARRPTVPVAGTARRPAGPVMARRLAVLAITLVSSLAVLLWFGMSGSGPLLRLDAPPMTAIAPAADIMDSTCTVRSEPPGAALVADDLILGVTPVTVRPTQPGRLRLVKTGYAPVDLDLPAYGPCSVDVQLTPGPR